MSRLASDVVYGPADLGYGSDGAARVIEGARGAHALFCVEIKRSELRPHAKAICDAKDPESPSVQLLMLLMHVTNKVGLCNVEGAKEHEGAEDDVSAYFKHETQGFKRRIDVFYEHVIHAQQPQPIAVRYTFVVNDPTVNVAMGIAEVMARNLKAARLRDKCTKARRPDDVDEKPPPWHAYRHFTSVHDLAQVIDAQLREQACCIDNEALLLGTELNDHDNPANVHQVLGYKARFGPHGTGIAAQYSTEVATGYHNLRWHPPYSRNVCHVPHKFTDPEIFFALPFCSVWLGGVREAPDPVARLAATARLRKRAEWLWKEFTDLEHLKTELEQQLANDEHFAAHNQLDERLRRACERKFWEVIDSGASRMPLVVKTILDGAAADGDEGVLSAPPPTQVAGTSLRGLSRFGRWLAGKFDDIYACGGIVAHLREFMRIDLVAYAALRRERNVLAPFIISRGIRGSGKSMHRETCLRRHRNGKRCGYQSAKSRFVHDRDRENEVYFPFDGTSCGCLACSGRGVCSLLTLWIRFLGELRRGAGAPRERARGAQRVREGREQRRQGDAQLRPRELGGLGPMGRGRQAQDHARHRVVLRGAHGQQQQGQQLDREHGQPPPRAGVSQQQHQAHPRHRRQRNGPRLRAGARRVDAAGSRRRKAHRHRP